MRRATVADLAHILAAAIATADPTIGRRIDDDPQATLDLVVITAQAYAETGKLLSSAVASARAAGWSWEAVGKALGMSRQAAQQRFGAKAELEELAPERKRLVGLMATNEMDAVNAMGRKGWHSVGYGPFFHDLEKTALQWEHRRVFVGSRKIKALETEGWERVGTMWFPWVYLEKSLGIPAEDDE